MKQNTTLDIVIPVFNEEKNIAILLIEIRKVLSTKFKEVNVILVDDGSKDNTSIIIRQIIEDIKDINLQYIKLSKNFGKEIAVKCGIDHSKADLCAIMDGDLQHPPEKLLEAFAKIQKGFDVVYISQQQRKDPFMKKMGAYSFKKLINHYSKSKVYLTDFTLLDKKAVKSLQQYKESDFYLRGILSIIGHSCIEVFYTPNQRRFGNSKFSILKLMKLAVGAVFATSIRPLRIAIYLGLTISLISIGFAALMLIEKIFFHQPIPGFATLSVGLFFMGGMQFMFLGVIGEYLGKTFLESKNRPQYLIDQEINSKTIALISDEKIYY
ncbi:MAG: glycosyltransferase family 2 protein [Candidatus Cyclobacteriaceae bacterium M3_2C_046]